MFDIKTHRLRLQIVYLAEIVTLAIRLTGSSQKTCFPSHL
jgi:hypothetical protein